MKRQGARGKVEHGGQGAWVSPSVPATTKARKARRRWPWAKAAKASTTSDSDTLSFFKFQ